MQRAYALIILLATANVAALVGWRCAVAKVTAVDCGTQPHLSHGPPVPVNLAASRHVAPLLRARGLGLVEVPTSLPCARIRTAPWPVQVRARWMA